MLRARALPTCFTATPSGPRSVLGAVDPKWRHREVKKPPQIAQLESGRARIGPRSLISGSVPLSTSCSTCQARAISKHLERAGPALGCLSGSPTQLSFEGNCSSSSSDGVTE